MPITMETDYAIRIVDCLARSEKKISAPKIAEKNKITVRFTLKILRKLVASGIISSYKGIHGGYKVAVPPEKITLYDIFEVIEGAYEFSRCIDCDYICSKNALSRCPYHYAFEEISHSVQSRLKSITVDDMIKKSNKCKSDSPQSL